MAKEYGQTFALESFMESINWYFVVCDAMRIIVYPPCAWHMHCVLSFDYLIAAEDCKGSLSFNPFSLPIA